MSISDLTAYATEIASPVWRVSSPRFDPMAAPPRELQRKSRFDDPMIDNELDQGGFAILYVGTDPKTVFLEVLSQFRKSISEMQD